MTESSPPNGRYFWYTVLVAGVFFATLAPTLRWPELTGGNENIVIQTALEMRRGGPWLIPNMLGEPRVKKPPLVAWITALTLRQSTLDRMEDPATREQAYRELAWQVRWTGLLAGCVTIIATFFLGRVLFDARTGWVAALVVSSTILFQKYMRQSTSDVHLAMWVTIANVFLVMALVRGRFWVGWTGAGLATAMAFLCKGPVALLATLLPAICFVGLIRWRVFRPNDTQRGLTNTVTDRSGRIPAVLTGVLIFSVLALPWFVYVYWTVPQVGSTWVTEVSRQGATGLGPDPIYAYLLRWPMNWPWLVGWVVGAIVLFRRRTPSDGYTLLLLVLPVIMMTFVPDRKERYLLPFVGPSAVISAAGMLEMLRAGKVEKWLRVVHWIGLWVVCTGFPIVAAIHPQMLRVDGSNWYPLGLAVWFAIGITAWVGLGVLFQRYWQNSILVITWASVLILQVLVMWGYQDSPGGKSVFKPLAEKIRQQAPGAAVFDWDDKVRVEEELAIYLNRVILPADPKTLSPVDRPIVYVTRQDKREPEPQPPRGWSLLGWVQDRQNRWWAFVKYPTP